MSALKEAVNNTYGHRPRMRVCGICLQEEKILLVKHNTIGIKGCLWAPPGGGIEFGESMEQTLVREFAEETGLEIEVGRFLFVNEYIHAPLHAVELFFEVKIKGGVLAIGTDPEMPLDKQLISEVQFISVTDVLQENLAYYHDLFRHISKAEDILQLQGYYSTR
jgi:8-oxo-dGTP diphosphatase